MAARTAAPARDGPWVQELEDLLRGFSGACLFGIPLLYTEEMWWLGARAEPWRLLVFLGLAFVANAGLAWGTGFKRQGTQHSPFAQAVDAMAIGAVASLVVLLVLNRLAGEGLAGIVGMVVVQAVPLSLGASVANAIFDPRRSREGEDESGGGGGVWAENARDAGATAIGAFFIAASIAPTQEVELLAASADAWHQVAIVALSLCATYAIVFESGFDPRGAARPRGLFQHPISETALAYTVALLVTGLALWTFHPLADAPLHDVLAHVVVLGLPAAIGGAAGRLVL